VSFLGGEHVVTGTSDGAMWVWNARDWKPASKLTAQNKCNIVGFLPSPDGTRLLSEGDDGVEKIWDTSDPGKPTLVIAFEIENRKWEGPWPAPVPVDRDVPVAGRPTAAAFTPDAQFLIATVEGALTVLNARTGRRIRALGKQLQKGRPFALSPNGKTVVMNTDRAVWAYPVDGGASRRLTDQGSTGEAFAFDPDGGRLAYSELNTGIHIVDAEQGGQLLMIATPSLLVPDQMRFSSGSDRLIGVGSPLRRVEDKSPSEQCALVLPAELRGEADKAADSLLHDLWQETFNVDKIREAIKTQPGIPADVRLRAATLAERMRDLPHTLAAEAWGLAKHPGRAATVYERAAKMATAAREQISDQSAPARLTALRALGIALYRAGKADESLGWLGGVAKVETESARPSPVTEGLLALALRACGKTKEAKEHFERMTALRKEDQWANDRDGEALSKEVTLMLKGP
jgi:hypothetical protein